MRLSGGETIPNPKDDEVIIFKEFFEARLRFSPHPLVIGVLKEVQSQVPPVEPF